MPWLPALPACCCPRGSRECQSPAYLLSGTIEGSALLFYLARPAGKRVPWGRGLHTSGYGQGQAVLRDPVWVLLPMGSSVPNKRLFGTFPAAFSCCDTGISGAAGLMRGWSPGLQAGEPIRTSEAERCLPLTEVVIWVFRVAPNTSGPPCPLRAAQDPQHSTVVSMFLPVPACAGRATVPAHSSAKPYRSTLGHSMRRQELPKPQAWEPQAKSGYMGYNREGGRHDTGAIGHKEPLVHLRGSWIPRC